MGFGDEVGRGGVSAGVAVIGTAAPETSLLQATRIVVTQHRMRKVPNCDLVFINFPPTWFPGGCVDIVRALA